MLQVWPKLLQDKYRRPVHRGSLLYSEGEPAGSIFFIKSGLVKLTKSIPGDRDAVIRIARAGDLFGERVITSSAPRDCAAHAVVDGVVYEYPKEKFLTMCRRDPDLWQWVTETLFQCMAEMERRMLLVCFCRVEDRILLSLADLAAGLAATSMDNGRVSIPLSQGELANLVGATRETTSSMLNALERRGLVQLGRREMVVPSGAALRAAAGGQ